MNRSIFAAAAGAAMLVAAHARAQGCHSEPISVSYFGPMMGYGGSTCGSVSADGRYVAFESNAADLIANDTLGTPDVFVRDRLLGVTVRANVRSDGAASTNGIYGAHRPMISGDGRIVAFASDAPDLVPSDTNHLADVFVHDLQTGETTRVSVDSNGLESNGGSGFVTAYFGGHPSLWDVGISISFDGRFVAFGSNASNSVPGDTNQTIDVFVHDRRLHTTVRASVATDGTQGNDLSMHPALSWDGRTIAFASLASTLVPGDTNGNLVGSDVFVHGLDSGRTERVSVSASGEQANGPCGFYWAWCGGYEGCPPHQLGRPSLSADGRFVAFTSEATNLVPGHVNASGAYVRDRAARTTRRVSVKPDGSPASDAILSTISADGTHVAFTSSDWLDPDHRAAGVFIVDLGSHGAKLVSLDESGTPDPAAGLAAPYLSLSSGGSVCIWETFAPYFDGDANGSVDVIAGVCP